jgi:alkylation response protein AidB-like acyl-CoA dehydrogenase
MNFDDAPQEAAFRAEARSWISANAPKQYEEELRKSSLGRTQLKGANILEVAKAWQKKKADAGWACLHWPKEYGGRGASPIERVIWQQEEGPFGKLSAMFIIGHGMCGPTMMAFAGEEQKRRYLPPLASGERIWCQLFSEPAGGSDVAGLRTRAEKQGDDWIINGQKIWTSGAHYSDYGILLTRTDPNVLAFTAQFASFERTLRSSIASPSSSIRLPQSSNNSGKPVETPAPIDMRSFISVVNDTFQPSFTAPSR